MASLPSRPSASEALQFALMLKAGLPTSDAIVYFFPEDFPAAELEAEHQRWRKSKVVAKACEKVQGRPWVEMTLDQQIQFSIDKHYAEMAYYLYSHNYSELQGADKTKADTCRVALEAKLAGMAGKLDALSSFFADLKSGKVALPQPAKQPVLQPELVN